MKLNYHDRFIEETAAELNLPEQLVMQIASDQWKTAKEATLSGSTIELSGLGRFIARMNIVEKKKAEFTNFFNAASREFEGYDKNSERWYPTYKKLKGLEYDLWFLNNKRQDPSLIKFRENKKRKQDEAGTEENT